MARPHMSARLTKLVHVPCRELKRKGSASTSDLSGWRIDTSRNANHDVNHIERMLPRAGFLDFWTLMEWVWGIRKDFPAVGISSGQRKTVLGWNWPSQERKRLIPEGDETRAAPKLILMLGFLHHLIEYQEGRPASTEVLYVWLISKKGFSQTPSINDHGLILAKWRPRARIKSRKDYTRKAYLGSGINVSSSQWSQSNSRLVNSVPSTNTSQRMIEMVAGV